MVAGFFVQAHRASVEVLFAAKVNDWIPVRVEARSGMGEALEILACARYRPERSPEKLHQALTSGQQGVGVRTFVISDTPVEYWADSLPPVGQPLVCLDTKGTYRKILKFKETREKGAAKLKVVTAEKG